jgi:hypothetical protein
MGPAERKETIMRGMVRGLMLWLLAVDDVHIFVS